ncbi:MAG: hypothetical protein LBL90_10960 [Prevotellaceae bacterium]|nr:hypothetical protein [Prevotellaceae bacterium]
MKNKLDEHRGSLDKQTSYPSEGIINSRTIKTAHPCTQEEGYDAGKKQKEENAGLLQTP